jgi:hypothetical protein
LSGGETQKTGPTGQRRLGGLAAVGKDCDLRGGLDWWRCIRAVGPVIRFSVTLIGVRGLAPEAWLAPLLTGVYAILLTRPAFVETSKANRRNRPLILFSFFTLFTWQCKRPSPAGRPAAIRFGAVYRRSVLPHGIYASFTITFPHYEHDRKNENANRYNCV